MRGPAFSSTTPPARSLGSWAWGAGAAQAAALVAGSARGTAAGQAQRRRRGKSTPSVTGGCVPPSQEAESWAPQSFASCADAGALPSWPCARRYIQPGKPVSLGGIYVGEGRNRPQGQLMVVLGAGNVVSLCRTRRARPSFAVAAGAHGRRRARPACGSLPCCACLALRQRAEGGGGQCLTQECHVVVAARCALPLACGRRGSWRSRTCCTRCLRRGTWCCSSRTPCRPTGSALPTTSW